MIGEMRHLDLGDIWLRHPEAKGLCWGCRESAEAHCERAGLDPAGIFLHDDRLTLAQVLEALKEAEGEVWDEYLSLFDFRGGAKAEERWPERYRWVACYVVTGGSEGLYLHVDLVTEGYDEHGAGVLRHLFTGKTLASGAEAWRQCWESAERIAWMLSA